jgi:succinate dehydrogenase cytochrome b556 subunit
MASTTPRTTKSSWSWILQAISGVLLAFLLGLHMFANHFVVQGGLRTYVDVVAYLAAPIIVVWEVLFLSVVTWHAMLGVRAIIFDLGLSRAAERAVTLVLTVIGVATVGYGLWLTYVIVTS